MGRCYENPPVQEPNHDTLSCPFVVDTFIGTLEAHLDKDIDAAAFDMYLEMTSFDTERDSAMFVFPHPTTAALASSAWMLPETTPGGSLLQGLVFCGTDQRKECPAEYWKSQGGAQWSFWQGVYSNFAKTAKGQVRMVLLGDNNTLSTIPPLWEEAVIPNILTGNATTSLDIIATNCEAEGVLALLEEIQTGLPDVPCNCTNIAEATNEKEEPLCKVANILEGPSTEKPETSAPDAVECQCPTSVYMVLFWGLIVFGAALAYAYWSVRHYLQGYQAIPETNNSEHPIPVLPKQ
ncbi:expressed unknown protein [Seminavis robusta]|uniref:ADP-ribosyl cyclase/cyclic ADP-ribose hydrolase n=1 Tax=Seminavis robusta TaxID=568900 RepID=A0A9N8EU93_9STRA|nr:expressed unknown protein [Seminavis robusta]|eukprot:Sro1705_g292480.1 n/a (293) ;mRNA; r:21652-22530